jgi:uncharacterized membrane protein
MGIGPVVAVAMDGARLKGNLLLHLVFAITSSAMLWVLWWLRVRHRRRGEPPGTAYFACAVVAAVLVALTEHLGGFVSRVNSG